jgi:hypothetical protein
MSHACALSKGLSPDKTSLGKHLKRDCIPLALVYILKVSLLLMLHSASTPMKPHYLPSCRGCRYYHGGDQLACAVHPYGPMHDFCADFVQKDQGKGRIIAGKIASCGLGINQGTKQILVDSLVLIGYIGALAWMIGMLLPPLSISQPESPQKYQNREGY